MTATLHPTDPQQFIITRKRKKYRFALFANSPLCFELDEWKSSRSATIIHSPIAQGQSLSNVVVELGAGTGLFSVELASRYPRQQFLAVDVKADRLQKGAREAEARGLRNVHFVRARADQLAEIVPPHSLEAIWLTFPDPFPKKRSAGRRMTHPRFLRLYEELLHHEGALYVKHDNRDFFLWSLEQLVAQKWRLEELSFDLHDSQLPDDYKILTTYEQRWLSQGLVTNLVKAAPPR